MHILPAPAILSVVTFLVATFVLAIPLESAMAQQQNQGQRGPGLFRPPHSGPAIGGTSLTLRDIWGPAEMPEPSMDYPGFDYPPGGYELNGPPSQSPYPN